MTGYAGGAGGGPIGCGAALFILIVTTSFMLGFIALIWWCLKSIGAI